VHSNKCRLMTESVHQVLPSTSSQAPPAIDIVNAFSLVSFTQLAFCKCLLKTACEEVDGSWRVTEVILLMDGQQQNYDTHHNNYQHTYIHIRHPNVPIKSDIHIHNYHENTNTNNKHPTTWMRKVDFKQLIYMP
jgi:hypothetical protein